MHSKCSSISTQLQQKRTRYKPFRLFAYARVHKLCTFFFYVLCYIKFSLKFAKGTPLQNKNRKTEHKARIKLKATREKRKKNIKVLEPLIITASIMLRGFLFSNFHNFRINYGCFVSFVCVFFLIICYSDQNIFVFLLAFSLRHFSASSAQNLRS